MIKFKFFNKDKSEEVNVKVESDNNSMDKIRSAANDACIERYNESVVNNIKAKLMLQYGVDRELRHMTHGWYKEMRLVDAICEDIAKEMDLLKPVNQRSIDK